LLRRQGDRFSVIGRGDARRNHNIPANLIQLWRIQFDCGGLNGEAIVNGQRWRSLRQSRSIAWSGPALFDAAQPHVAGLGGIKPSKDKGQE
jgi:hypothetical protein